MRVVKDIHDVQIVLNELLDWKNLLETKSNDMHGLQIKNVGAATADSDAVILTQVKSEIEKIQRLITAVTTKIEKINAEITKIWVELP